MTANQRVQELREGLHLTKEAFGARVGVTKVAIWNIERGNRRVTDQMCRSICREFHVNPSWLMDGEGEMLTQDADYVMNLFCDQYQLDARERALLTAYVQLDAPSKQTLLSSLGLILKMSSAVQETATDSGAGKDDTTCEEV